MHIPYCNECDVGMDYTELSISLNLVDDYYDNKRVKCAVCPLCGKIELYIDPPEFDLDVEVVIDKDTGLKTIIPKATGAEPHEISEKAKKGKNKKWWQKK